MAWDHGLLAWCGLGSDPVAAEAPLAAAMEGLYQRPFSDFARYAPRGRPADVAEALAPYVEAGAATILLSPFAPEPEEALAGAAEVAGLLRRG